MPIATAGDGGGSIRIPAGFTGLFGLKNTYGRIPKGPMAEIGSITAVIGCVSRSVRDTARWLDVCNGFDPRDPLSLPRVEGWEASLGTLDLRGRKAVVAPTLGAAVVLPEVGGDRGRGGRGAGRGTRGARARRHSGGASGRQPQWALAGLAGVLALLGDRYPACEPDLTMEIAFGLQIATEAYNVTAAAGVERYRVDVNETMAAVFDQVDFVIASSNPDVAFGAKGPLPDKVGDRDAGLGNNGALTIPANISGNPAVTIPAGAHDGLPVGLQVIGRHHEDALLLDLSLAAERSHPWPLVTPGSPL